MKYLKLFENYKVDKREYPEDGYELSSREKEILKDLVGDYYYSIFNIKKDDDYYYTHFNHSVYYNRFDNFNDLKDYIQFKYFTFDEKKILELLKKTKLNISFDNNSVIRASSEIGNTEVVKILLQDPRVDPSDNDNEAIRLASRYGHTKIVKLLLQDPRVDPGAQGNYAIIWASRNGYIEIVKLLLQDPRVDPSADNNAAIRYASPNGHTEIVKLLLSDSRVRLKLSVGEINKYLNEIS